MADLGAIGYTLGSTKASDGALGDHVGALAAASAALPAISNVVVSTTMLTASDSPTIRVIAGTVSVLGTPTSGLRVRAYRRDNGAMLGEAVSGAGGVFSIAVVDFSGEATVVAYDNTGVAPDYNAQVFDRVLPV